MIELFEKYVDWKILAHFLRNPRIAFHIKEIAREIGVSPGSVSTAVKRFKEKQLLLKEEKGLAHFFKLNEEHPVAIALKKLYGLMRVYEAKPIEKFQMVDENIISLALFGSYANGRYDEKSDVDFLVITPSKKEVLEKAVRLLEKELGIGVSISVFKLARWRKLARMDDPFYKRVIKNHILLYGSGIE